SCQSMNEGVPDQADGNAFQLKVFRCGGDVNGLEVRVGGVQPDAVGETLEALDRDFVAEAGHDNLAVAGFLAALDRQQVSFKNARVFHAQAAHLQQIVRDLLEQGGIHGQRFINIGRGQYRVT